MPIIQVVTPIRADITRCFDLARDLDLHVRSQAGSGERAVAGRTSGLIELGESVTWEARHLGLRQRFTSRITEFERPTRFQDQMVRGAFKSFVHDHVFEAVPAGTVMTDRLAFESPFGFIGTLFNRVFLSGYMYRLLEERALAIQHEAEGMDQSLSPPQGVSTSKRP